MFVSSVNFARPMTTFRGNNQAQKQVPPSEEELKKAGYPSTYTKDGIEYVRDIAAEKGMSDDFDCDHEGDPDYMAKPVYATRDLYDRIRNLD